MVFLYCRLSLYIYRSVFFVCLFVYLCICFYYILVSVSLFVFNYLAPLNNFCLVYRQMLTSSLTRFIRMQNFCENAFLKKNLWDPFSWDKRVIKSAVISMKHFVRHLVCKVAESMIYSVWLQVGSI